MNWKDHSPSKAETRARELLANNGRNTANSNEGIRVGSHLHLCEMLLADIDTLRGKLIACNSVDEPAALSPEPTAGQATREIIIAEIMKLVRPEPTRRDKPTIAELEKILNSKTSEAVNINSDGSVSVQPSVTTVSAVADAILAALRAMRLQDGAVTQDKQGTI